MIKTKTWIIIFVSVIVICAAIYVYTGSRPAPGMIANIYQDGVCIRSIDLGSLTAPETFTVYCDGGENTILAEPGRICVSDADCPDKICVNDGWLSDSASPIVCLPHRLVIRLEAKTPAPGGDGIDTVSR